MSMSDYSKWSKFDVEKTEEDISAKEDLKDRERQAQTLTNSKLKEIATLKNSADEQAEILASKMAVDSLKLKGVRSSRQTRRLNKSNNNSNIDSPMKLSDRDPNKHINPNVSPDIPFLVNSVSTAVGDLLILIETLHQYSKDESKYHEGYVLALQGFNLQKSLQATKSNLENMLSCEQELELTLVSLTDIQQSCLYLSNQLEYLASIFSVALGKFAMCCDMCRLYIKTASKGAQYLEFTWLLRGLAFAAIGVPFLARKHCHQAKLANVDYFNIEDIENYLQNQQDSYARISIFENIESSVVAYIWRALYFHGNTLKNVDKLAKEPSIQCQSFVRLSFITKNHFDECIGLKYSSKLKECFPESHSKLSLSEVIAHVKHKILAEADMSRYPTLRKLIREVFYEAQILFLENFYYSAEVKYWVCLAFIDISKMDDLSLMSYTCLMNIISCRIQRSSVDDLDGFTKYPNITRREVEVTTLGGQSNGEISESSTSNLVDRYIRLSTLDLCDACIQSRDTIAARYRKILFLKGRKRFVDALEETDKTLNALNIDYLNESCRGLVCWHNDANEFSQRFMSGLLDTNELIGFLGDSGYSTQGDASNMPMFLESSRSVLESMKNQLIYLISAVAT